MTNIIYFGSPEFSAKILESLLAGSDPAIKVVAVVTNPDKLVGRNQVLTPSPVAQLAQKHHLPTFKPQTLDDQNLLHLKLLKPDLFLIAAYGKIIPQSWLDLPTIAPLNLHFSLLPKYRGALCIQQALKNQDKETGVTLMQVDAEMDHGPILAQRKQTIDLNDNTATLTEKLTLKAIELLEKIPEFVEGTIKPIPQDHSQASYTPSYRELTHANAFIPWSELQQAIAGKNAAKTHALIRSLNPEPGAWTKQGGLEFKILRTTLENDKLTLDQVQIPGKNPISFKQVLSRLK